MNKVLSKRFAAACGACVFWLAPFGAYASPTPGGATPTSAALMQTMVGLLVVVGAILAIAWVAKKANFGSFSRNAAMRVVSVLPVGTRERIVLVDINGQQLLLGVAPGRVTTLQTFEEPVVPVNTSKDAKASSAFPLSARSASEFSRKLNDFLGQGQKDI